MAKAMLTTLTPVHIGSGQTLQKDFDFISADGKICILDLDKIVEKIGEPSIPLLTAQIENHRPLRELPALRNIELEEICSYTAPASQISGSTQELKAHYRTALQGLCIPGSSIKGSIKTALFEALATREFLKRQPIDSFGRKRYNRKTGQEERVYADTVIEKELFGNKATEKLTRFIKIGDCAFGEKQQSGVFETGIYNLGHNGWSFKPERVLVETIAAHANAEFDCKLDIDWLIKNTQYYPDIWRRLQTNILSDGMPQLCKTINEYTKRQLTFEIDDLHNAYFDEEEEGKAMLDQLRAILKQTSGEDAVAGKAIILRVGGYNGWNFTTGGWMKKNEVQDKLTDDNDYRDLRLCIQKKDRMNIDLWPKTRKMTTGGIPLGFVKITFQA